LVAWLAIIFASFSLFAQVNTTLIVVLFLLALLRPKLYLVGEGSKLKATSDEDRIMLRAPCLALSALLLATPSGSPAFAASRALHILDTDKDGTIDMNEANAAASTLFDQLDRDEDGTLSARELHGRLSLAEIKKADPDRDGTISKEEYLALVAEFFKRADHDGDGTLDEHELRSPAGRKLQKLLRR
jgi:hypothetical protein